ncbi:hypothetical protein VISI1226_20565 [Vibrio sinaloensis DSM 21326]|uniref:Uncharacterized protein n=1 Tax=Vibrio sinaloensis DSM 21326 TaxID=945550 RepID=E8M0Y7_PHOS4|nr:hypothetical protein [Vibrio sinaloensis]EGA72373.1 hypothetical protein VISI1226_20565 [Vibrio sinaloensis DSM 21326]
MKTLSIQDCQRDLAALDAADQLTASVEGEVNKLKNMDMSNLMSKATKMLMTGSFSLDALGLAPNFFEQIEQLTKLNNVARKKYRAHVTANLNQLDSIEDAQVVEAGDE